MKDALDTKPKVAMWQHLVAVFHSTSLRELLQLQCPNILSTHQLRPTFCKFDSMSTARSHSFSLQTRLFWLSSTTIVIRPRIQPCPCLSTKAVLASSRNSSTPLT